MASQGYTAAYTRPQRRISAQKPGSQRQQHIGLVLLLSTIVGAVAIQQGMSWSHSDVASAQTQGDAPLPVGDDVTAPPGAKDPSAVPEPSPGGVTSPTSTTSATSPAESPSTSTASPSSSTTTSKRTSLAQPTPTSPSSTTSKRGTTRVSASSLGVGASKRVAHSSGYVMGVAGNSTAAGAKLELGPSTGSLTQSWVLQSAEHNTIRLRNSATGMCVTLSGGAVVQQGCGAGEQRLQAWRTSSGGLILRFATTGVSMSVSGSTVVGGSGASWAFA